jgi:hypothetical protein
MLFSFWSWEVRTQLFNRAVLAAALVAGGLGLVLPGFFLRFATPPGEPPLAVILSSYVICLCGFGYLLTRLPSADSDKSAQSCSGAWLAGGMVAAAAFAGLFFAPGNTESARTMLMLWLLFAAQSGFLAAAHGLLRLLFSRSGEAARTCSLLLLCVLVSSLFWTKPLIQAAGRESPSENLKPPAAISRDVKLSDHIATAVAKLSPPMSIAAVWFMESDAGRNTSGEGQRFDLIRGALTYGVWIGSAQGAPYPEMRPEWREADAGGFSPGLPLALLAWSIPLMLLADILSALARKKNANAPGG